ncbi:hypothetical protein PPYR_10650 [Photinus pyralis]|uniref:ER membrane protein complex subunit 1 n=1 Tax=Photinus pyralis TaxID=7054 RepID=A0A1Y1KW78_PHOPY|nr:ER membrane protein complex subunit 1 [Photinus pyralis]KAB0796589.1 hypothetical protein PPYR_10650 [Photinus pyralis]
MLSTRFFKYFVFAYLFNLSSCLYEDQIGKFDWKLNYVGNVKYGIIDSTKRVIVGTEENVVASLSLKNGQILWRQVLENPSVNQIELLHVDKEVTSVSGGKGTWYVRGWDSSSGSLLWEWSFYVENKQHPYWVLSKDQLIHIIPVLGSHLEVTSYDVRSGRNNGKTTKISTPWVSDLSKCKTVGVYWACISGDDSSGQLYYIDLSSATNQVYKVAIHSLIGNPPGHVRLQSLENGEENLFLVRNNVARLVKLQPEMPHVYPYSLSDKAVTVFNGDQPLLLQTIQNSPSKLQLQTIELQDGKENVFEMDYNNEAGIANIISAVCKGSACRVFVKSNDDSVSLLQLPGGKVSWTREEGLSRVIAVEFFELPLSELDASIEHEFDSISGDMLSTFYNRIASQLRQLLVLLSGQQGNSNVGMVRDEFGLHKIIVVVTASGRFYGLDSLTGNIVWSQYLKGVEAYSVLGKLSIPLFAQRSARYSPLMAQCAALMKDKSTGKGVMYTFDPITGQSIGTVERLPYQIEQAMLLPYEDDKHLKGLLILSDKYEVIVYPSTTKPIMLKHANSVFLFTVNSNSKILQGYNLVHSTDNALKATPTWTLNLGQADVISVNVRPSSERVHSQGRVLADRSVLYKYVNPNLLAIATLMEDPIHKQVLSIYLVDGVTGLIVYSAAHKRVAKPIHLVHSENWLVYSYYNARFRRVEFAAVELYEGPTQSNSTSFSSHSVSQLPHPENQAYIFPGTPLAMHATMTERGITNKHILVALSNGAVIEVPWAFLEPRGPHGTMNMEEGYIPYIPELPIPPEATINYNQSIPHVRGIQVAPARLESTCLVLVYGLDLFYTRVTPSKTFDLLKEDFDHWLIAIVLIGLTGASYVTKRLASRKALKQAWK